MAALGGLCGTSDLVLIAVPDLVPGRVNPTTEGSHARGCDGGKVSLEFDDSGRCSEFAIQDVDVGRLVGGRGEGVCVVKAERVDG